MSIEVLKSRIEWAKKSPVFQIREAATSALECAVAIIEAQDKRLAKLEKQMTAIKHG